MTGNIIRMKSEFEKTGSVRQVEFHQPSSMEEAQEWLHQLGIDVQVIASQLAEYKDTGTVGGEIKDDGWRARANKARALKLAEMKSIKGWVSSKRREAMREACKSDKTADALLAALINLIDDFEKNHPEYEMHYLHRGTLDAREYLSVKYGG